VTKTLAYHVIIEPSGLDDGVYTATIPALEIVTDAVGPGAARRAARRAIAGWIEVARSHRHPIPPPDSIVVELARPAPNRAAHRLAPNVGKSSTRRTKQTRR